jgi:RNA polymerase sigma-70 factor (ECF subfamily)
VSTSSQSTEDSDLVAQIAAGDSLAFEAVYDRHSAQVFSLAMRVTGRRRAAEESTQDAFLTLWRSAGSYDATRSTLRNWLLCIVRNRSIDWLRRERRHDRALEMDEGLVGHLEASERTDEQFAVLEQAHEARQLVLGLPTEQRQVVELAYFNGLTQAEIAVKVGIPLGTVKGRQRLALTKMHRELTGAPVVALSI